MQTRVGDIVVGEIGIVGTSIGSPVVGAAIGASVGIGSLVGRVGPLDGTEGEEGVVGLVGLVGFVIVGDVGVLVGCPAGVLCFVGAFVGKLILMGIILIMDSK